MSPLDDLDLGLDVAIDGSELMLELVAAVTYMRCGIRPGFIVWDAIEEAVRWHLGFEPDWHDPDPLATSLRRLASANSVVAMSETLTMALRSWLTASAEALNDGGGDPLIDGARQHRCAVGCDVDSAMFAVCSHCRDDVAVA
jgi:hypothetical protein